MPGVIADLFDRIDLSGRSSVIVALSGGSDSLALLVLFQEFLQRNHLAIELVAVTVDHGLRPESAEEARQMAGLCGELRITHLTRRWNRQGALTGGIAAAARMARYQLLTEAALQLGTDLVLTGHTADDQAETVYMRQRRGNGVGLAGMAAATLFEGRCWIVRPLLKARREMLRDLLRQRGLSWIEDPTNRDTKYERVRARLTLTAKNAHSGMLALAEEGARLRIALSEGAGQAIAQFAALVSPGLVRLDGDFLAPEENVLHALRLLLACSGGKARLPGLRETRQLQRELVAGRSGLSRAMAVPEGGRILIHREMREVPLVDEGGIFDARYRISIEASRQGWRLMRSGSYPARQAGPRASALACEPVLAAPHPGAYPAPGIRPYLAPFELFLPGFDLAIAGACTSLYGRAAFPAPPLDELPQCMRI